MSGRVLVVEDDDQVRASFAQTLREAGFEVDVAEDGEHGLDRLNQPGARYQVVLVDAMLPGIDGAAMLKAAGAELLAGVSVLLLSGAPDALAHRLEGLDVTPLSKPIAPQALVAAVQAAGARAGG